MTGLRIDLTPMVSALKEFGAEMEKVAASLQAMYPVLHAYVRGPESRAGHDWESRSWFA